MPGGGTNQRIKELKSRQGERIKEQEQLYEEVIRLKQLANVQREDNIKLKTKVKVLENDMARKERTLEDFFQQSQYIA